MRLLAEWMDELTLQQQAVLVMACRGFDGTVKHSAHKPIVRTLRAHCLVAAKLGRLWKLEDGYSDFMTLDYIQSDENWNPIVQGFVDEWDSYNVHAALHLIHAAEVLGYKLPDRSMRERWYKFYYYVCRECLHTHSETESEMDKRLNDWGNTWKRKANPRRAI